MMKYFHLMVFIVNNWYFHVYKPYLHIDLENNEDNDIFLFPKIRDMLGPALANLSFTSISNTSLGNPTNVNS